MGLCKNSKTPLKYSSIKGTVLNSKYLDKKVSLYSKEVQLLNYLV